MIKKILYYEDIEEATFKEIQEIINWYGELEKKENQFYLSNRKEIQVNCRRNIEGFDPVLECYTTVIDVLTLKELEEALQKEDYELRNKGQGDRTEELNSRIFKSVNHQGQECYWFIDLNFRINLKKL